MCDILFGCCELCTQCFISLASCPCKCGTCDCSSNDKTKNEYRAVPKKDIVLTATTTPVRIMSRDANINF